MKSAEKEERAYITRVRHEEISATFGAAKSASGMPLPSPWYRYIFSSGRPYTNLAPAAKMSFAFFVSLLDHSKPGLIEDIAAAFFGITRGAVASINHEYYRHHAKSPAGSG